MPAARNSILTNLSPSGAVQGAAASAVQGGGVANPSERPSVAQVARPWDRPQDAPSLARWALLNCVTALPCFRITLAYDGTAYAGWQLQPSVPTIQGTLEQALQRIVGVPVRVAASGRTDAGVHALGQVASFQCDTRLTPEVLRRALNANTPPDIFVSEVRLAPDRFHATRDAVSKRYRYVIQDGPQRDVFSRTTAWHVPEVLDVPRMQAGAQWLVGTARLSQLRGGRGAAEDQRAHDSGPSPGAL